MPEPRIILPILERRAVIEDALRRHQVVVICGETGSGKTTQLPQICLDMGPEGSAGGRGGLIGHTQPRRIAARAVAARIAQERGESVGGVVGVKIRFQDQTSPRTRIKVMTDGILLAELASDPKLLAYSTIIIDEAHERSLNIDFVLGYLKGLLPGRQDLRLIVTSATIDPQRFSDFFGGPAVAPIIQVSGRTFPVELRYQPTGASEEDFDRIEFEAVADAVEDLCGPRADGGDVLVFLPGERDIRLAGDAIARRRIDAQVLPLFSRLTNQEQDRIFAAPDGRRRIILATNVAETSLTVPGIRSVVDTGLARQSRYDAGRKVQRLPIEPISRASADQRAGRCGRVASGICVRLYSQESYRSRPAFTDPEIRRTNLASVILRLKALGGSVGAIEEFPFLDAPDAEAIRDGYETLFELGAIDAAGPSGSLTKIGERMSRIPLDPRIARMLLAADVEGALDELVVLSAVLSIQDPRERPMSRQEDADRAQAVFRHESSDFMTLLRLWDQYRHASDQLSAGALVGWCRDHFLSAARMREWGEMACQLRDIADELRLRRAAAPAGEAAVHRSLLTGLITNVACREGDGSFDYRGVRGNVVQIFPGSVLFKKGPKWIMAAEVVQTTRLYARTLARVEPAWIEELAGHMFRRQLTDPHLNPQTGQPCAWERLTMSGIVVVPRREADLETLDPPSAREVFIGDGLVRARWETDAPFMRHNREIRERAKGAEASVRRRDVLVSDRDIFAWFEERIPKHIAGPHAFEAWRREAERSNPRILMLSIEDLVLPPAHRCVDPALYPREIRLSADPTASTCTVEYALAPGKDQDGITFTVQVASLPDLTVERLEWGVPGIVPEIVQGMIKTLPKALRASIESRGALPEIASACSDVLRFGEGSIATAIGEALEILYAVEVSPPAWSIRSLPSHLRVRVRVVDDEGKELAADRDLAALLKRFEARIHKARSARERGAYERVGLTTWNFGDLAEEVEVERGGEVARAYPMVVDRGNSVSLTLAASADEAKVQTPRGLRRLYAIACRDEVGYYLDALPRWNEMVREYSQLGNEAELRDHLTCIIAERVFLEGQGAIRTQAEFVERRGEMWGRLSTVAREVGETVARILEPRHRVAHRISGGTPRLWAHSVADLREQAAYLMPSGFLIQVSWERLRRYPRYVEGMRQRLFALREDGSQAETQALARFEPNWKRFTAWVAAAMSSHRAMQADEGGQLQSQASTTPRIKAPLPPARRAAPTVNIGAGEWAMQPGNLPQAVERYRWALEELRLTLLVPGLADGGMSIDEVEQIWSRVPPATV